MVVVVGNPRGRGSLARRGLAGLPAAVATSAARHGAAIQLVGRIGDDAAGDSTLIALAREGVGHAAILRDAAHPTPISADDPAAEAGGSLSSAVLDSGSPVAADTPEDGPRLEAADLDLALRYLGEIRGIVIADPLPAPILTVAADAAAYMGAELVVVATRASAADLPATALVFEPPGDDADGAFATMLGEIAAAIDRGSSAADALAEIRSRLATPSP